jgi:lipoic acid synthetase
MVYVKRDRINDGNRIRRPQWLKVSPFCGERYQQIRSRLRDLTLHTVCEEANCPNRGECFNSGTATFLLMGPICSRNCRFCNIPGGRPGPIDPDEPKNVALVAAELGLDHVVVTSVTRDDLPDEGAGQFRETVIEIRKALPKATIEVLTPDFHARAELLELVLSSEPTVFNHNVETVPRLYPTVRPKADYRRSLDVLEYAAKNYTNIRTKSGLMVGLGESGVELEQVFADLAGIGVEILTIGQYLAPSTNHHPIIRYYSPDEFADLKTAAENRGIPIVVSAPLVRSSYKAGEAIS